MKANLSLRSAGGRCVRLGACAGLILAIVIGCRALGVLRDVSAAGSSTVNVIAVEPPSGILRLDSTVRVIFSRAVQSVPDSLKSRAAGKTAPETPPARWDPEIDGVWQWAAPDRLEFIPRGPYKPNVVYRLAINPRVASAARLSLRGNRKFTFIAEPMYCVEASILIDRPDPVRQVYCAVGTFRFSAAIDRARVERLLSLRLDRRGPVEYRIDPEADPMVVSFRSAEIVPEEREEKLTATLQPGLRPRDSGGWLREGIVTTASVPSHEKLAIERLHFDGTRGREGAYLTFSHPVRVEDVKENLSIDPPVANIEFLGEGREVRIAAAWAPDTRYSLRISASLSSVDGLRLGGAFEGSVHRPPPEPSLEILGEGNVLCLRGERKIAVRTMNVDEMEVRIDRIFTNNLVPFLQADGFRGLGRRGGYSLDRIASPVYAAKLPVSSPARDCEIVTAISLDDALRNEAGGIFRLTVESHDAHSLSAAKGIVTTDLGIIAKKAAGELLAAVVSIHDQQPLAGVTVTLMSFNNQVLASGKTDSDGMIRFGDLVTDSPGQRPFVITAVHGGDLGFLGLEDARTSADGLDVGGQPYSTKGYDAFLYTDRDIFRPGDTARIAWIVRDTSFQAPDSFPLSLVVTGPTGKVFSESRVFSGSDGVGEFRLPIPSWAQTGQYAVSLRLDTATCIGTREITVEDFIPDRMKVVCDLIVDGGAHAEGDPPARRGQSIEVRATAMTLFGPPASDRIAKAEVHLAAVPARFDSFPGFRFGEMLGDRGLPPLALGERRTDSLGVASWDLRLPQAEGLQGWLSARVDLQVEELGGGRLVRASREMLYAPAQYLIGLRQPESARGDFRSPGEEIPFDAVLVDMDGRPAAADSACLSIVQRRWRTVVRHEPDGRYHYASEVDEKVVSRQSLALGARVTRLSTTVSEHGCYRLVLADPRTGASASQEFYVYGWGYAPWAMSRPERVGVKLDKVTYAAGESINAQIEAPFEGLLLLTIETDRVLHREWVRLASNSATIRLRMPAEARPNAYVVATLLRPLQSLATHAPARAYGAVPILMDRSDHSLAIETRIPETSAPRQEIAIAFRMPGLPAASTARVTVAAVDEGILQITGFATPSPLDHFFRKRRLDVASLDAWRLLMPEYERILETSDAGGDGSGEEMRRRNLSPISVRRVEPVSLWSGIVTGSADWREVRFTLPEWNGALRVMVVGCAGPRFGSMEQIVRVRDPLVLNANLPRFLAPGDSIRVPVQIYNGLPGGAGAPVPIEVSMRLSGPVEPIDGLGAREAGSTIVVDVPAGEERMATFGVRARDAIGDAVLEFSAAAGEAHTRSTTRMAVRPPQPLRTEAYTGVVREGRPARHTFRTSWYEGSTRQTVAVSSLPLTQFGAALPYLLRYPYGCAEQVTSKCFPMVCFSDLAQRLAPDRFGDNDADYYVHEGIDRLLACQLSTGAFALWPGRGSDSGNAWLTVYVTHFLIEADQARYRVPAEALAKAIGELRRIVRDPEVRFDRGASRGSDVWCAWSDTERLRIEAYALFVLALYGEPEHGAMDHVLANRLDRLGAVQRTLLGGAYALCGETRTMDAILPAELPASEESALGMTWRSAAADEGLQLLVLATAAPGHAHIPALVQRLGKRAGDGTGRWRNTQENGLALVALGKLIRQRVAEPASGEIVLNGEVAASFGPEGTTISRGDWAGKAVEIRVTGKGVGYFSILDEGIPVKPEAMESDAGITVRREYLDTQGAPIGLDRIRHGDVIVCRLTAASQIGPVRDVLIADLVPAGLEIENPRLLEEKPQVNRAGAGRFADGRPSDGRPSRLPVDCLDIRDDRLLLFTRLDARPREFSYELRAITAGSFVLPPVKAESMYDPAVGSVRGAGRIVVATAR